MLGNEIYNCRLKMSLSGKKNIGNKEGLNKD